MIGKHAALTALALLAASAPVHADVVISTAATQNMSCSGGVCAPTATAAVLNVTDLENLLASGSLEVTTTGSGIQANNISAAVRLDVSTGNTLALDAYQSITFNRPVVVKGTSGLSLITNDGGSGGLLSFMPGKGHAALDLSSNLSINGAIYQLEDSLPALAAAMNANRGGAFALASSYDASQDGTYDSPPLTFEFTGTLEGLGNTISNLTIDGGQGGAGLFSEIQSGVLVENLGLTNIAMTGGSAGAFTVYNSGGTLAHDWATGSVSGGVVGGLAVTGATIEDCFSSVSVVGVADGGVAGGLVGYEAGAIDSSYSTGTVSAVGARGRTHLGEAGGLVGQLDSGTISNSYATGAVSGGQYVIAGGFAGRTFDNISSSYSSGAVSGGQRRRTGGFAGVVLSGTFADAYWDTTTSGTKSGVGSGNATGITGLTTSQLQSGLPTGFDPAIWAEDANINNGLPYLIANPPPK
ncbi:MAG TPA: GLUG motif-containing protein [Rhizomicrobium sp.]|nr:GLUG motif-containing protein [Rhizomicrobium sp.]